MFAVLLLALAAAQEVSGPDIPESAWAIPFRLEDDIPSGSRFCIVTTTITPGWRPSFVLDCGGPIQNIYGRNMVDKKTGAPIDFDTEVDVLNAMQSHGWTLNSSYGYTMRALASGPAMNTIGTLSIIEDLVGVLATGQRPNAQDTWPESHVHFYVFERPRSQADVVK